MKAINKKRAIVDATDVQAWRIMIQHEANITGTAYAMFNAMNRELGGVAFMVLEVAHEN